jgi:hypothetical protein
MNKYYAPALEVMYRSRDELIQETALSGSNGGVGRSQNYAPVLANVLKCIEYLESTLTKVPKESEPEVVARGPGRPAKQ